MLVGANECTNGACNFFKSGMVFFKEKSILLTGVVWTLSIALSIENYTYLVNT